VVGWAKVRRTASSRNWGAASSGISSLRAAARRWTSGSTPCTSPAPAIFGTCGSRGRSNRHGVARRVKAAGPGENDRVDRDGERLEHCGLERVHLLRQRNNVRLRTGRPRGKPQRSRKSKLWLGGGGFRREVQPGRQHWFLNEKSGLPFRPPGLLLGFQGTKTARRERISSPSVTPGCTSPQNSGALTPR
jgi:hypothetical protein